MFVHAFQGFRCSTAGCNCYCIIDAAANGTCDYYDNPSYKIYKYVEDSSANDEADLKTKTYASIGTIDVVYSNRIQLRAVL